MSEYVVIYEQAEDGDWGAYLPDLPGVVALGAGREEVSEGIQEALAAYVNGHRELPIRGHFFSPLVAIFSPRWWPRSSPPDRVVERLVATKLPSREGRG